MLVAVACGGAKPAPSAAPSNTGGGAAVFRCEGRSASVWYEQTAGQWDHRAIRLSCDGDRPAIEVSGQMKDEDHERTVDAPLDGPAFEKAWAALDAAGWPKLKGDDECAVDPRSARETRFEIARGAAHVKVECQAFVTDLPGAYAQVFGVLHDAATAAGLDDIDVDRIKQ